MNSIPLPNEIIRIIYKYINPIWEYVEYIENIKAYSTTKLELCILCNDCHSISYDGTTEEKIDNCLNISAYSCLATEHLTRIHTFINRNPKFKRGVNEDHLATHQYKKQFDHEISKENVRRMEFNISIHRGAWAYPYRSIEVLLFHSIPYVIFEGTLIDIVYSCVINNVKEFEPSLREYMSAHKIEKPNEKVMVDFVNFYCAAWSAGRFNDTYYRQSLIKKLMKV